MKTKKIFIVGCSGTIGETTLKMLSTETDHEIVGSCFELPNYFNDISLNIHKVSSLRFKELRKIILKEKPNVIVNCSGISDPVFAEANKKLTWDLNVKLVEHLVSISKVLEAHLITFSCEWVFDGNKGPYKEDDRPNPINYLGKSKLAAENFVQTNINFYSIIRLPLVYGVLGKTDFVRKIIAADMEKGYTLPLKYTTNPVWADEVAWGIMKIIDMELTGIFHFGGANIVNVRDFIDYIRIFTQQDLTPVNLRPPILFSSGEIKSFGLQTALSQALLSMKFTSVVNGLYNYFSQYRTRSFDYLDGFDRLIELL